MNTELLTKPMVWRLAGWGLFLGFAPGLATAFTSRWWLAALIVPALSYPLVDSVDWILFARAEFSTSEGFEKYLRNLIEPGILQVGSALLTIPATLLYAL